MARKEAGIVRAWTDLLVLLHCNQGADTKMLAEAAEREATGVRYDLGQMLVRGLVRAEKRSNRLYWWVVDPVSVQTGLIDCGPKIDRKTLESRVKKAHKATGRDVTQHPLVKNAKWRYRDSCGEQVNITWDEANRHLVKWKGSLTDLCVYLSWGWGSVAIWRCGCRRVTPWASNEGRLEACLFDVDCWRLHKDRRMAKLGKQEATSSQRTFAVFVPALPRSAVQKKVTVITYGSCFRMQDPPSGIGEGDSYRAECGCVYVVCSVKYIPGCGDKSWLQGVIAADRGTLCAEHEKEVDASIVV